MDRLTEEQIWRKFVDADYRASELQKENRQKQVLVDQLTETINMLDTRVQRYQEAVRGMEEGLDTLSDINKKLEAEVLILRGESQQKNKRRRVRRSR